MTDYKEFQVPYSLIIVISPRGQANKIVAFAREHGSSGATIVPVTSASKNKWLRLFEIASISRELILMVVKHEVAGQLIKDIGEKFNFGAKNTGIAFSLPISHLLGSEDASFDDLPGDEETKAPLGSALFVIVDEDKADDIIDLAYEEGVRGATVIEAIGSAEMSNLVFDFPISPRKEAIIFVGDREAIDSLQSKIDTAMEIELPGAGISFYLSVEHTAGLAIGGE